MISRKLGECPDTKLIPFAIFCAHGQGMDAVKAFEVSQLITYDKSDELIVKLDRYLDQYSGTQT